MYTLVEGGIIGVVTIGAPPSRLLLDTGSLRAGRFAIGRDHPEFAEAGQVRRHVFVFPRTGVWIEHERERTSSTP
jgi:hypothetical protein